MIEAQIQRLIDAYVAKVAAAKSDGEGVGHFLDLVREVAAARASADFMLFEHEAERCAGEEDPDALRTRLAKAISDQRVAFAALIADSCAHVKDDPVERSNYERFASAAYGESFDKLLKTVSAGGHA